jgi:hypothetical protein
MRVGIGAGVLRLNRLEPRTWARKASNVRYGVCQDAPVPEILSLFPPHVSVGPEGHLTVAGVRADQIAEEFGTPAYVVDEDHLRDRARRFEAAMKDGWPGGGRASWASKAFPCTAVYRVMAEEGLGVDVAGLVAQRVVDVLEPVEVAEQHGRGRLVLGGLLAHLPEPLQEAGAVVETGQLVTGRRFARVDLGLPAGRDVLDLHDGLGRLGAVQRQGRPGDLQPALVAPAGHSLLDPRSAVEGQLRQPAEGVVVAIRDV